MKQNKLLKIISILSLSIVSVYIYSGFFGNPISYMKAKSEIKSYIDKNYKGSLKIEDISYNTKMNGYDASVVDLEDSRYSSNIYYHNTGNIGDDYYFRTKMNMEEEIKSNIEAIIAQSTSLKKEILTIDLPQIEIPKFRYKIFEKYSGKEPINLSINLHPKNEEGLYNEKPLYKNEDEFKKDAYETLNVLKNTKYKYESIEIYSYREDGNSSYTLESNENFKEKVYIKNMKKKKN